MKAKRKELRHHTRKKKIHCVLFFNLTMNPDPNFFYLTGYDGYGCLALIKDRGVLFVPPMEFERAKKAAKGIRVITYRKNLWQLLRRCAKGRVVGIDYSSITLSFMRLLRKELRRKRFVDVSSLLREIRSVKTEKEIRILKKACSISDRILKKFFSNFRKFKTEKDAAEFLESETIKNGCALAFPPIVASGAGAAEPHHVPTNKKIKKGFCIIDFGVRYKGYHSDTTRTVYVGKPSKKEKELYGLMLKVQTEVAGSIRPGQRCSDIYSLSLKKLGKYSKNFIHGLGHGVGVQIHELPDLKPKSRMKMQKGMVFTVEPGIYFRNRMGIRIEDTILMAGKPAVLTRTSKTLRTF